MSSPSSKDPRELPLYSQREAADIIGVSSSTLRGWVADTGTGALLRLPNSSRRLSFNNLVEGYVLRSLRVRHAVAPSAIRRAIRYAEEELEVERLLLRKELRWAGDLFWDALSDLINLSRSGQYSMRQVFEAYLNRIEWGDDGLPVQFFPRVDSEPDAKRLVVDPRVGFGQPTVRGAGIGTSVIARRYNAGETVEDIARDYRIGPEEVRDAVVFEGEG